MTIEDPRIDDDQRPDPVETTVAVTFHLQIPGEPGQDDMALIRAWANDAYNVTTELDFVAEVTYADPMVINPDET